MNVTIHWWHVIAFLLIASLVRVFKRVGRRCRKDGCGYIWVKTINKTEFAPEECIPVRRPDDFKSWLSLLKRLVDGPCGFRLWVRNVRKETFTSCRCGHKELVRTSERPISIFHILWIHIKDANQIPDQFKEDAELNTVSIMAHRDHKLRPPIRQGRLESLPIRLFFVPREESQKASV